MKKIFIDLETTGVDRQKHGVWQIAGLIEIDDIPLQTFNIKTDIYSSNEVDEEALKVGNITPDDLKSFGDPRKHLRDFVGLLDSYVNKYDKTDKFYFIGYNSTFDMEFLRKWFLQGGNKYFGAYFFFPDIDVMRIAAYHFLKQNKRPENYKQFTVAKFLGIEIDESKLHDALYDIELTKLIYEKLQEV